MKCIVETTGSFMLLNSTMEAIDSDKPSVTTQTPFVDIRINKKELKVLARNLPRKASDEDFQKVCKLMEGDVKAAVEAYCAELGVTIDGESRDDTIVDDESELLKIKEAEEAEALKIKEAEAEAEALKIKEEQEAADAKAKADKEAEEGGNNEDSKSTDGDSKGDANDESKTDEKVSEAGKAKAKPKGKSKSKK